MCDMWERQGSSPSPLSLASAVSSSEAHTGPSALPRLTCLEARWGGVHSGPVGHGMRVPEACGRGEGWASGSFPFSFPLLLFPLRTLFSDPSCGLGSVPS